jgi:hypothetical protein
MNTLLTTIRALCALAVVALLIGACASSPAPSEPSTATPAPQAEAPLPADGIDYACAQDADCVVKNLGSCCGYNPRCMNDRSMPVPEQCGQGMMGSCGFPEITHCACQESRCVSMQGNRPLN